MIGADVGNAAVIAIMGASAAVVYKLLGLALPRIGRSVMQDEIKKGMTASMAPVTEKLDAFTEQLNVLDGKVSAHLIEEARDVRGIYDEMRVRNEQHDRVHDRLWAAIREGDERRRA
jgi:hypothetical protein